MRFNPFFQNLRQQRLIELYEDLAWLLKSGRDETAAVQEIMQSSKDAFVTKTLKKIALAIGQGKTLGQSLVEVLSLEERLDMQLLQDAKGLKLSEVLLFLSADMKRRMQWRDVRRPLLLAPWIQAVLILIIITVINLFVLPQFAQLFSSFGVDLPALTRFMINFSNWFASNSLILLLIALGLFFAYKKVNSVRYFIHRQSLKAPISGRFYIERMTLEFLHRLSGLCGVKGLSNQECIGLAASGIENRYLRNEMTSDMDEAASLTEWLRQHELIPRRVSQLLDANELAPLQNADFRAYLESQAENLMRRGMISYTAIDSLLKFIVVVVIGLVIVAMYLPIFLLGSVI